MGEAYNWVVSICLNETLPTPISQSDQTAKMVKYVAHPLNYRCIPSYNLGLASWLHFPARHDLRYGAGTAPEFVRSSAVPAVPLLGDALTLSTNSAIQKVDFSHSLRGAQETVFRLKQDVKLLDNRPLHTK